MPYDRLVIGQRLAAKRYLLKLTQAELAQKAGVMNYWRVSVIENGHWPPGIRLSTIASLASALDLPLEELFKGF